VSVIATASNTVNPTFTVGIRPLAFGLFIQPQPPAPRFAGTPGRSDCQGQSMSQLAHFGGMDAAAAALGFPSVTALRSAIRTFCQA
jgi:hypothetical protein